MKKLNTIITAVMLAMLVVFVGGCGNGEIAIVKNGILGSNTSLTVGKALDNYSYFATKEWKVIETENGRKVVEFRATYDAAESLLKNTDIEQFYLVIQFTINADKKSFNLSYIGKEVVQKDGKVKNDALYFADSTIKNIFQDKDTMSYVAPAVIKAKAQRFNNIAVGEILDNYKYFKSIKWDSSKSNFIGTLELDNNAKKSNIKQQQVEYLYSSSGGSICIISGGRFRLTKEYSNGQKESCSLPKEDLMQTLINNKKISLFNNSKAFTRR